MGNTQRWSFDEREVHGWSRNNKSVNKFGSDQKAQNFGMCTANSWFVPLHMGYLCSEVHVKRMSELDIFGIYIPVLTVSLWWICFDVHMWSQACSKTVWMSYADEYFLILCINCTLAVSIAFRCHMCGKHRHWDSGCLREFCVCVCVCVRACVFFFFFFLNKEECVRIIFDGMPAFFFFFTV